MMMSNLGCLICHRAGVIAPTPSQPTRSRPRLPSFTEEMIPSLTFRFCSQIFLRWWVSGRFLPMSTWVNRQLLIPAIFCFDILCSCADPGFPYLLHRFLVGRGTGQICVPSHLGTAGISLVQRTHFDGQGQGQG